MAFGLYSLIEAAILCLNAVCILHEERFLAKIHNKRQHVADDTFTYRRRCFYKRSFGWGAEQHSGFGEAPGVKSQILNLIRSIRTVMRFPLIGVNVATIILKLLFG